MPYNIICRESTWNWVYYLFFFVLICTFAFFCHLFYKALKLVLDRKAIAALAAKDKMAHAVNISVWFNFILYLAMIVCSLLVLKAAYSDMFNGFTEASITSDRVDLKYLWPVPNVEIRRSEIKSIKSMKWGKKRMVLEVTTQSGLTYKSASGYPDDVSQIQAEFSQDLNMVTPGR